MATRGQSKTITNEMVTSESLTLPSHHDAVADGNRFVSTLLNAGQPDNEVIIRKERPSVQETWSSHPNE